MIGTEQPCKQCMNTQVWPAHTGFIRFGKVWENWDAFFQDWKVWEKCPFWSRFWKVWEFQDNGQQNICKHKGGFGKKPKVKWWMVKGKYIYLTWNHWLLDLNLVWENGLKVWEFGESKNPVWTLIWYRR